MSKQYFNKKEALKGLEEYIYHAGEYTTIDNIMNYFWFKIERQIPDDVAPNVLSAIGIVIMAISGLIPLYYDLNFHTFKPQWVFIFNAIAVFLFQTLDGIDGKHARRTGTSSPLGQIFDHGGDSISSIFLLIGISHAVKLQKDNLITLFIGAQCLLYIVNWSERHLKTLTTQVGNFGVTEVQFILIGFYLVTAIYGQDVWHKEIGDLVIQSYQHWIPIQYKKATTVSIFVSFFIYIIILFGLIMFFSTLRKADNKLQCFKDMCPILCLTLCEYMWTCHSYFDNQLAILIIGFSFEFSLLCVKLIITTTSKIDLPFYHPELILHFLFAIVQYLMVIYGIPQIYIQYFSIFVGLFTIIYFITFMQEVIGIIANHLGIYCFSVAKRNKVKKEK